MKILSKNLINIMISTLKPFFSFERMDEDRGDPYADYSYDGHKTPGPSKPSRWLSFGTRARKPSTSQPHEEPQHSHE